MSSLSLATLRISVGRCMIPSGRWRVREGIPLACRELSDSVVGASNDHSVVPAPTKDMATSQGRTWTWSTPSPLRTGRTPPTIPVKPRVNLTVTEIVEALEAQGALDVRVIDLKGKGTGMGDAMVFSTATTPLHMRRLANMIVHALKKRKLLNAMGCTGAEGRECDDWMLVDCDNLIVHVMIEETRRELDLEAYWSNVGSSAKSALQNKRERGETGFVEDHVDLEEEFAGYEMEMANQAQYMETTNDSQQPR